MMTNVCLCIQGDGIRVICVVSSICMTGSPIRAVTGFDVSGESLLRVHVSWWLVLRVLNVFFFGGGKCFDFINF